jgi:hypothetical protein
MKSFTLYLKTLILAGLMLVFCTTGRTQMLSSANGKKFLKVTSNHFSAVVLDPSYFALPFLESWDQGTFSNHEWSFSPGQGNWNINSTSGNPHPAAYFSSTPVVYNYSYSLISPMLDASAFTCADIWFSFDLKLDDHIATGKEKFDVDVNYTGNWINKAKFTNNTGTTSWATSRLKIDTAMGKVFQVRFRVTGDTSSNIIGWSLDNIHVYAVCRGPRNLNSSNTSYDTHLTWVAPTCDPTGPDSQWIHWDSGENSTSIGTGGAVFFNIAARWTAEMIRYLKGGIITKISFFPVNAGTTNFRARVWEGTVDSLNMVSDMMVDSVKYNQWNWVTLSTPVPVNTETELWIGMDVNTSGGYPAGVDAGPAIDGFGDMIQWSGAWTTLISLNPALDYNWNVQAYIEPVAGDSKQGSHLLGYNVYRTPDNASSPFNLINNPPVIDTTYTDSHSIGTPSGTSWYYYVTAVYENQVSPGTILCEGLSDTVSTVFTGENELNKGKIAVYPNPSAGIVNVSSDAVIDNIGLMNCSGEYVYNETGKSGKHIVLDLSGFQNGLYFLRLTTIKGTHTTKLTIIH